MIFHSAFVLTTIFCFISTILICCGTFTVLFAIYKNPRKEQKTPSMLLFINLCVSDFLTGCVLGMMLSADALMDVYGLNSVILDGFIFILGSLFLFANNLTIAVISIDRLIAVLRPLRYKTFVTLKTVKLAIGAIWILAFFISLLPVFGVSKWVFLLIYSHSHVTIPLSSLTGVYLTIFKVLSNKRKELRALQSEPKNYGTATEHLHRSREKRRMERDRKMTLTIILVMLTFSISSVPFLICVHLMIYIENCPNCISLFGQQIITSIFYFSARFVLLNAVCDPILIILRIPRIRAAVNSTIICAKFLLIKRKVHNCQINVAPFDQVVLDRRDTAAEFTIEYTP